ncbi:hypothetical protein FOIG_05500 [Fusarium odoratissimum NRRL 54006]|uniref:Uncharacterized protein n=2 Tax=Fusarium oxysporum species complex TaxID=171631 RepID=X0K570_FUSO5|nr:uncharacterized protein FOIG_05500 [Fusarium odoratissimum NRRL 54006]EXM03857.1 hypothetical protein FOIG_05500 [Fusarium odoratissimum NRRL 54006]TXC10456.1 hypothetical protein FocTR4_00005708 [Fusarium oxysporum f. sp. cubense]
MHGSDGGMVTYLDEAISKAVQCEISSKASGFSSFCPRERQRQETDGQVLVPHTNGTSPTQG